MKKIKIIIKDNNKYAEVAWLVDKSKYLKEIIGLRNRIKLKKIIPYDQFKSTRIFYCNPNKKQRIELERLSERLEILETHNWDGMNNEEIINIERSIKEINDSKTNFQKSIKEIQNLFGIGNSFKDVIIKSVVCNEIREIDLKNPSNFFTIKKIRLKRKWYWMHKKYSYTQIIKRDKKHKNLVRNSVISAINKYKSFLTVLRK